MEKDDPGAARQDRDPRCFSSDPGHHAARQVHHEVFEEDEERHVLELTSYEDVTLNVAKVAAGRETLTTEYYGDLPRAKSKAPRRHEFTEKMKELLAAGERVLVVTFRKRAEEPDFQKTIRDDLIKAKVPGEHLERLETLTWGKHTSQNQFSDCTAVVLVGTFYQYLTYLRGRCYAQMRLTMGRSDVKDLVTGRLVTEARHSELAHDCFQAISRAQNRKTRGGRALLLRSTSYAGTSIRSRIA